MATLPDIAERVAQILPRHACTHILCVSGGIDSIALLHVYDSLLRSGRLQGDAVVFHLDHRLRAESAADADFVCATARSAGFPVYLESRNVSEFARRLKVGLEEAGRELRYRILDRLVTRLSKPTLPAIVVTAHHADDYLESLLIHLIRGGGMAALSTLPLYDVVRGQQRFRPLVLFDKRQIVAAMKDLTFREDASNAGRDFLRNRIRQDVIPLLQREGLSSTRLWENFHDVQTNSPTIPVCSHIKLDRALLHGSTALQVKSLLDIVMDRMHLPPASRALVVSIEDRCRRERFRLRLESSEFRVWSDERGPVHFFRSDSPLFREMHVVREAGECLVSYGNRKQLIRVGVGESVVCFSDGMMYRAGTHRRKVKKLFQELGIPSVVRRFVPIVADSNGFAVRICLSFFEGSDLFFYEDARKELTVNPASM
ncbi:MAG: tRNA lysidine(34) synthetase TilS [Leptospirales bacterium]|nr:tRNA lysidine(34) synthetase TilS [Leptospirales bacterium]